jgi:ABC-2 type transport system ATP-binding protein
VSAVLSARGVAKRFGKLEALRAVSLEARAGETIAVVGPNGAGKTTLLSIIAGVQPPSEGTVVGPSAPPSGGSPIGWVPQRPALYSKLSVAENLRLFARLERLSDPDRAVARMLEQADLADRAEERLDRLSGGSRQRVNVAIGLIADPPLLALDEPSASLDPTQRERLWEFIGVLTRRGTAVVFSSHNVGEAWRYADRVIVLDRGRELFDDTPRALLEATGEGAGGDFERALVAFLAARASR